MNSGYSPTSPGRAPNRSPSRGRGGPGRGDRCLFRRCKDCTGFQEDPSLRRRISDAPPPYPSPPTEGTISVGILLSCGHCLDRCIPSNGDDAPETQADITWPWSHPIPVRQRGRPAPRGIQTPPEQCQAVVNQDQNQSQVTAAPCLGDGATCSKVNVALF